MKVLLSLAPALLLGVGTLVCGCRTTPEDAFDRDGFVDPHGDDDDDSADNPLGGNPEGGDRVAFWDVVRHSTFDAEGPVSYETRASFFEPDVLASPQPGVEECFANGTDAPDPWAPIPTSEAYGVPVLKADGEDWELELIGTDYWRRNLPERVWQSGADLDLFLPGAELGEATQYDDVLSLPTTLVGTSIELSGDDGLTVTWVPDVEINQLLLVLKGDDSGRTEYVVCAPLDDGEFTIPPIMFDGYPAGEVEVLLRRERTNDRWILGETGWGRTVGISQVRAEFTIFSDTFGGGGDDDDSAGDDDDSAP